LSIIFLVRSVALERVTANDTSLHRETSRMKNKIAIGLLAVLTALVAPCLTASAQPKTIQLTTALAYNNIGMFNGGAVVVVTPFSNTNACAVIPIGAGGLTATTTVLGTSSTDWITTVNSSVNLCGMTVTPLVTRGFFLTLNGLGGDDLVGNQYNSGVTVLGGIGNDSLWNYSSTTSFRTAGGSGDDTIQVDAGDFAVGEAGNDRFIFNSWTQPTRIEGGSDPADLVCGGGFAMQESGIDGRRANLDCSG